MKVSETTYELKLYRKNGVWVFDDWEMRLIEEPLILGTTEMIDAIIGPNHEKAIIRFCDGYGAFNHTLLRERAHEDGYYYRLVETDMQGWICPAALHYFPNGHPLAISVAAVAVA